MYIPARNQPEKSQLGDKIKHLRNKIGWLIPWRLNEEEIILSWEKRNGHWKFQIRGACIINLAENKWKELVTC